MQASRLVTRANYFLGLVILAAFLPQALFAEQQKDAIVMKNGDRLTGKVKRLEQGVLKFDLDYVDGTLSIDWGKVARLESSAMFIFTLKDGSLHSGKLTTPDTDVAGPSQIQILEEQRPPLAVDNSDVVRVVPTSESMLNRFGGRITSGTQYSKGNNTTQYSISSELDYRETNWGAASSYSGSLSSSSGATTSTRNEVGLLAYRMLPWRNYFYAGSARFLQSSVQGIQRQTNLGAGIGRYLKNTNSMRFSLIGGLGWQGTHYIPAALTEQSQKLAVGFMMADLDIFSFKRTTLNTNASLAPALTDVGRNFARTNVSYYIKLFGKFDWNFSFYGNWDTKPPVHLQSSDYGTTTGLSYTFGTK